MKSSKVSIKTRSTPASLSFKGPATKHITVKWSIMLTESHSIALSVKNGPKTSESDSTGLC